MSQNREAMIQLFDSCDQSGDGVVSVVELRDGIKANLCADIDDKKVVAIFSDLDMDGDNKITKQEFLTQMCDKIDRRVGFTQKFNELDKDGSGSLTRDELAPLLRQYGLGDDAFDQCDLDGSGKVSCEEFMKLM